MCDEWSFLFVILFKKVFVKFERRDESVFTLFRRCKINSKDRLKQFFKLAGNWQEDHVTADHEATENVDNANNGDQETEESKVDVEEQAENVEDKQEE